MIGEWGIRGGRVRGLEFRSTYSPLLISFLIFDMKSPEKYNWMYKKKIYIHAPPTPCHRKKNTEEFFFAYKIEELTFRHAFIFLIFF